MLAHAAKRRDFTLSDFTHDLVQFLERQVSFGGVPIKRLDALRVNEATVS